jgi:hypothetical protein
MSKCGAVRSKRISDLNTSLCSVEIVKNMLRWARSAEGIRKTRLVQFSSLRCSLSLKLSHDILPATSSGYLHTLLYSLRFAVSCQSGREVANIQCKVSSFRHYYAILTASTLIKEPQSDSDETIFTSRFPSTVPHVIRLSMMS